MELGLLLVPGFKSTPNPIGRAFDSGHNCLRHSILLGATLNDVFRYVPGDFPFRCDLRKAFLDHLKKHNPDNKQRGILTGNSINVFITVVTSWDGTNDNTCSTPDGINVFVTMNYSSNAWGTGECSTPDGINVFVTGRKSFVRRLASPCAQRLTASTYSSPTFGRHGCD